MEICRIYTSKTLFPPYFHNKTTLVAEKSRRDEMIIG